MLVKDMSVTIRSQNPCAEIPKNGVLLDREILLMVHRYLFQFEKPIRLDKIEPFVSNYCWHNNQFKRTIWKLSTYEEFRTLWDVGIGRHWYGKEGSVYYYQPLNDVERNIYLAYHGKL